MYSNFSTYYISTYINSIITLRLDSSGGYAHWSLAWSLVTILRLSLPMQFGFNITYGVWCWNSNLWSYILHLVEAICITEILHVCTFYYLYSRYIKNVSLNSFQLIMQKCKRNKLFINKPRNLLDWNDYWGKLVFDNRQ